MYPNSCVLVQSYSWCKVTFHEVEHDSAQEDEEEYEDQVHHDRHHHWLHTPHTYIKHLTTNLLTIFTKRHNSSTSDDLRVDKH